MKGVAEKKWMSVRCLRGDHATCDNHACQCVCHAGGEKQDALAAKRHAVTKCNLCDENGMAFDERFDKAYRCSHLVGFS